MNPQDIPSNLIFYAIGFYAVCTLLSLFFVNKFFGERRYRSAKSKTTMYIRAKRPWLDALLTFASFVPGLNTLGLIVGLLIWFIFHD